MRRVAVRTHRPLWQKVLTALVLSVVLALGGFGLFEAGRAWTRSDSVSALPASAASSDRLSELEAELVLTRQQADAAHSSLRIERSAQAQLTARIRTLEDENARLREDILVFESLAGASDAVADQAFRINRFAVEPDAQPGRYRYRMLIVRQGGRADVDVQGRYQVIATIDRGGSGATISVPADEDRTHGALTFRHFQRVDGELVLEKGSKLMSLEARFMLDNQIKARATASL